MTAEDYKKLWSQTAATIAAGILSHPDTDREDQARAVRDGINLSLRILKEVDAQIDSIRPGFDVDPMSIGELKK